MNKKELEKATLASKGLVDFFKQFGDDVHTRVLLEEILEGVINAEALFVFGEQEQEGGEAGDSASDDGEECNQFEIDRPVKSESATSLPEKDREDYL